MKTFSMLFLLLLYTAVPFMANAAEVKRDDDEFAARMAYENMRNRLTTDFRNAFTKIRCGLVVIDEHGNDITYSRGGFSYTTSKEGDIIKAKLFPSLSSNNANDSDTVFFKWFVEEIANRAGIVCGASSFTYSGANAAQCFLSNGQSNTSEYLKLFFMSPEYRKAHKAHEVQEEQKRTSDPRLLEWVGKSNSSFKNKDWAEVVRTSSAAISLDSKLTDQYLNRACAYFHKGFPEDAIQDCNAVLKKDPDNASAYSYRALAYIGKGLSREALADCDKAKALDPKSAIAYNSSGYVLQEMGEKEKAIKEYEKSCLMGFEEGCTNYRAITGYLPSEIPQVVINLINQSKDIFEKGDWDGVISKTTEALKLDPRNGIAYANRAGAYANKGMLREALQDCNAAISINPDYAIAYNNRGFVYERSGRMKEAALDYEIGCKLGIELGCSNYKRLSGQSKGQK